MKILIFIALFTLLIVFAGSCTTALPGSQTITTPATTLVPTISPALTSPAITQTQTPVDTPSPGTQKPTTQTPAPTASNTASTGVWHAGVTDVNGNAMYGTETMRILPYKGKLYASNSLWMESDPSIPKACQLLVLDAPDSNWKLFYQFTARNLRLCSLQTVTFSVDASGHQIEPVTMLLAGTDVVSAGDVQIFSLDDNTGKLVPMTLGATTKANQTRAIGSHHDSVTGIDLVFAGNDVLGMFSGAYDPAMPGRIKWGKSPEMSIPSGERVMGFTNSGGVLYCSTSRHIYKRTDGPKPSWQQIYYCAQETSAVGIRGLTAVPNPSGKGEVLLFAALSKVRHLDPANNYKETVELDMNGYLTKLWSRSVTMVLSAYNDFLPYNVPGTGENVYLFGFEAQYNKSEAASHPDWHVFKTPFGYLAAEAYYFIRHTGANGVSFEVKEITDPTLPTPVSIRTIAISPFAADRGQVLYFGGFDCNSQPSHNTAWISRGSLSVKDRNSTR